MSPTPKFSILKKKKKITLFHTIKGLTHSSMCFTDVREMYTEENSTCLSGVTDQPDCPVRTSQPSASQTCAGSLPRQLCRHWGPFSPQLPPLDLRLHRGPSRGRQPALRHRSSSTLELPAHTGAKRQHVTPGCSPEGRPWQGPVWVSIPTAAQHTASISVWTKNHSLGSVLPQEDGAGVKTVGGGLS